MLDQSKLRYNVYQGRTAQKSHSAAVLSFMMETSKSAQHKEIFH